MNIMARNDRRVDAGSRWISESVEFSTSSRCSGWKGRKLRSPIANWINVQSLTVILMALVDSSHEFLYVTVESSGIILDGRIFGSCSLQEALESRISSIPPPAPLPASDQMAPCCIVADESFPLRAYILKTYPDCILSNSIPSTTGIKHAFGILTNHFRVFLTTIPVQNFEPGVYTHSV